MKLTTNGRYAVTAMLDLALHEGDHPVCAADIAARQGISQAYLEQLLARLRSHGLLVSTRGPGGGYKLARASDAIAFSDIIAAVDKNIGATHCKGSANCSEDRTCLAHSLWRELSEQIQIFLSAVSLADAAARPSVREVAARQDRRQQGVRFHIAAIGTPAESLPLRTKAGRS